MKWIGNQKKIWKYQFYFVYLYNSKKTKMAKNIIIYKSHWELIESLSVEQVGHLMKGIAKFSKGEEVTFNDTLLTGIWMVMKRDFIVQSENYEKKKEANKRNGKLGGRPKTQITEDNPENPVGYSLTQFNPKNPSGFSETQHNPQNLKDKEKEKETDIDKDSILSLVSNKAVTAEIFDEYFNEL